MKFIKDILVFHCEATGNDPERDAIIQLAGVLLDKDNLLEKQFFNSYIKTSFIDGTLRLHAEYLRVPFETIRSSHNLSENVRRFTNAFPGSPMLATHGMNNYLFLRQAFKKSHVKFDYPDQALDLWSLSYIYTLHYGIKKMPTQDTLRTHFNIAIKNRTSALDRARASAEIFRRITKG